MEQSYDQELEQNVSLVQSTNGSALKHKDYYFLCGEPLTFKGVSGIKKIKYEMMVGLLKRAQANVKFILVKDEEDWGAHYQHGKILYQMNLYEQALDEYKQVPETSRYFTKALANQASVYCQAREFKKALELFDQIDYSKLTQIEKIKHDLKKANTLKRAACFPECHALLIDLKLRVQEISEEQEGDDAYITTNSDKAKCFKLMFKVLRDLARLAACRKDKESENLYEQEAQDVYVEYLRQIGITENSSGMMGFPVFNIKIFKILFHRAYRLSGDKDYEALEIYQKLLEGLDGLMGSHRNKDSFYHMRTCIEIAKSHAHLGEPEKCREFLRKGRSIAKKRYASDHAVFMDYYKAFLECSATCKKLAEQSEIDEKIKEMFDMERKINVREVSLLEGLGGGKIEVFPFINEAYFIKCQVLMNIEQPDTEQNLEAIRGICAEMDKEQAQNGGDILGNQFTWSCKTFLSFLLINQKKSDEAAEVLTQVIEAKREYYKDFQDHCSLEQPLRYLAMIYSNLRQYEKAEQVYRELFAVRINAYGESSIEVIPGTLVLIQLQLSMQKFDDAMNLIEIGTPICEKLIENEKAKNDNPKVVTYYMEILQLAFRTAQLQKQNKEQMVASDKIMNFTKKEYGESSSQYADAIYMRAKVLYSMGNYLDSIALVNKCIKIEVAHPLTGKPHDMTVGMMYLLKASILVKLSNDDKKVREGLKAYQKALTILGNITGAKMDIASLVAKVQMEYQQSVEQYSQSTGNYLSKEQLDHLSEDEDHDPQDLKGHATVQTLMNPFQMMHMVNRTNLTNPYVKAPETPKQK